LVDVEPNQKVSIGEPTAPPVFVRLRANVSEPALIDVSVNVPLALGGAEAFAFGRKPRARRDIARITTRIKRERFSK
jgi:hypothetical protein